MRTRRLVSGARPAASVDEQPYLDREAEDQRQHPVPEPSDLLEDVAERIGQPDRRDVDADQHCAGRCAPRAAAPAELAVKIPVEVLGRLRRGRRALDRLERHFANGAGPWLVRSDLGVHRAGVWPLLYSRRGSNDRPALAMLSVFRVLHGETPREGARVVPAAPLVESPARRLDFSKDEALGDWDAHRQRAIISPAGRPIGFPCSCWKGGEGATGSSSKGGAIVSLSYPVSSRSY